MTKLIVTNLQDEKPSEDPVSKSLNRKILKPARPAYQQLALAQKAKYFLLDQNAPSLRKVVLKPERSATDSNPLSLSKMLPTRAKDDQLKQNPFTSLPMPGGSSRREPAKSSMYPVLDKKPTDSTTTLKNTSSSVFQQPRANPPPREEPPTAKPLKRITAELLGSKFSKQAFTFRLFESWKELA